MRRDLVNNISPVHGVSPSNSNTADNTPVTTDWVDTAGFESLTFLIATGTLADADATFAVSMQSANLADKSDAAAVPDSDTIGTLANAGFDYSKDDSVRKIGYRGLGRYVRLTITPAANASAAAL